MNNQKSEKPFDLAIIGAGPAGISCALAAKKYNLKEISIQADAILLLTGYRPNCELLEKATININKETLVPEFDEDTLESNVKGIYLAGSIIAGKNSNKIFIENSREHGDKIINHVWNSIGQKSI